MDADGANQRNISRRPEADLAPAWGPDGDSIAFYTHSADSYRIHVMDANGGNQHPLVGRRQGGSPPKTSP
jgi:Tol biopolymer transport system component